MEIQLKLYGSSKMLSNKDTLNIQLPNNSNIKSHTGSQKQENNKIAHKYPMR